jgi:hypothetical protein
MRNDAFASQQLQMSQRRACELTGMGSRQLWLRTEAGPDAQREALIALATETTVRIPAAARTAGTARSAASVMRVPESCRYCAQ